MSMYTEDQLVEMAYLYLVDGMIQMEIEERMGLLPGTVSSELKPYRITGQKNVEGRGGWGQKGNHCGVAAQDRIGYEVTREDIRDFMFHQDMSLEQFLDRLGQQKEKSDTSAVSMENDADRPGRNNAENLKAKYGAVTAAVALLVAFIFRRQIFKGVGIFLGYIIPVGLFSLIVLTIFSILIKKGQTKPQSADLGDYTGYFIGSAVVAAVFVVFKKIFLYELNDTWSVVLLLAGYASIIYAIILFIWRFVMHRGKVNDLVKKLDILYAGYVLGVVLLAVFAGVVDGITAKVMIGIYIAAIGVIVTA